MPIQADTLGNFYNSYLNSHGTTNAFTQVFFSAFDTTYVAIGAFKTGVFGSNSLYRLYICKFNSTTLQPIWRKTYAKAQLINSLNDAVINSDGSIVVCGTYADSLANMTSINYNANGVILKVKANGDSLWMRQYDNNAPNPPMQVYQEMLRSIERTSDGGYITCGSIYGQPNSKAWVIKVDSLGCFNVNCTPSNISVIENEQKDGIVVFPNPVINKLKVEFKDNILLRTINITNVLGQKIIEITSSHMSQEIDVTILPKGLYFLSTQVNGQSKTYKIIKE